MAPRRLRTAASLGVLIGSVALYGRRWVDGCLKIGRRESPGGNRTDSDTALSSHSRCWRILGAGGHAWQERSSQALQP